MGMGARALKDKAAKYMSAHNKDAETINSQNEKISAQSDQLSALEKKIAALTKAQSKD